MAYPHKQSITPKKPSLLDSLSKLTDEPIPESLRQAAERQITRLKLGVLEG